MATVKEAAFKNCCLINQNQRKVTIIMRNSAFAYKQLLKEYDFRRTRAAHEQRMRQEEVYKKIPEIQQIDEELSHIGIQLVRSTLTSFDEGILKEFEMQSQELQMAKQMLLVEAGFPKDYLEIKYTCPVCQDTGYVNNEKCTCFKQALIQLAYEQSNLKDLLQYENFDHFNFDYYSREKDERFGKSPYENMKNAYELCVGFIEKFDTEKQNILFYGPTGLGKTFLCNCIAKELLDRGYNVIYLTAPQLFKLFNEARFHREDMPEVSKDILDTLFTVDLLVLDDLGTEAASSFTGPDLFDVINTRGLNQKSTIISTNLKPNELNTFYSERIISRLRGNYINQPFFGTDIRLMKKYQKK